MDKNDNPARDVVKKSASPQKSDTNVGGAANIYNAASQLSSFYMSRKDETGQTSNKQCIYQYEGRHAKGALGFSGSSLVSVLRNIARRRCFSNGNNRPLLRDRHGAGKHVLGVVVQGSREAWSFFSDEM
ncbi:hypothetical protein BOTNAR_0169g00200 [Botryotinia narcissicola]|uniref:Uncharacterized protein n=1 Tax=Botryotinia narcissicola TaxID=278944 RepID=A0A4Z1IEV9_9HELO|nr:hypothetical protein BOTNAR_0169g00200 [Botryotinia narcissicola]